MSLSSSQVPTDGRSAVKLERTVCGFAAYSMGNSLHPSFSHGVTISAGPPRANGQRGASSPITDKLPFGPHDYQLEGITQAFNGQDVVAVSATGSGKSAYILYLHAAAGFPCSFRCWGIRIFIVQMLFGSTFGWRSCRIILKYASS